MGSSRSGKKMSAKRNANSLAIRLDEKSKGCLREAADLRQMTVSDYIRAVAVPQAKREIQAARKRVVALTPDEQLAFWNALKETPVLTSTQRRLGAIMRGEADSVLSTEY